MRKTGPLVLVVALLFVVPASQADTPRRGEEPPGPGYVTIQFGRTQWATAKNCVQLERSVDLGEIATAMTVRGLVGTGGVVLDRTPESGLGCFRGYTLHTGWRWMRRMQAQGWSFISQSRSYRQMTTLSYEAQVEESCGTLPDFSAHDINHADALFAFPANQWTPEIQEDPVSKCFSFGRRYLSNAPNVRSEMESPWFANTMSVSGGFCHSAILPCHTQAGTAGQPKSGYSNPRNIADAMFAEPDTWYSVQFYRFVRGAFQNNSMGWDCEAEDWREHWTSNGELYCWNDVRRILNAAEEARESGVVFTGPHTVALDWGRALPTT